MEHSARPELVTPLELKNHMNGTEAPMTVHILPEEHFLKQHLPGAVNACVYEVTFLEQIENLAQGLNQRIVVYGSDGRSSEARCAAEKLLRAGYSAILVLEGGLEAWIEAGLTVEGTHIHDPIEDDNTLSLADGAFEVDIQQSVIEWRGRNPNGRHHGTVQLSQGRLEVQDNQITGEFEINMKTIKNIDLENDPLQPVLIAHLRSDDFFFVKQHPTARYVIESAVPFSQAPSSVPNCQVTGFLELRGVKKPLTFPATISSLSGSEISLEAHFDFDRTLWNVIYGSSRFFRHLGMHLVFDPISIQVRVVAGHLSSKLEARS